MANVTQIPAPRVELIDPRTGLMSREWFRFFNNLYTLTGGGTTDTSLADLQLAPVYQLTSPDATAADLAPQTVTVAEPQFDLSPRDELGTLASQNADNVRVGTLTVTDNVIQGTAAKGFNFTANTPLAGMTSQLLNWYEQGTYTPTFTADSGTAPSVGNGTLTGAYTRIGRLVQAQVKLLLGTTTTMGSGGVLQFGLPFAAGSASGATGTAYIDDTGTGWTIGFPTLRSTTIVDISLAVPGVIGTTRVTNTAPMIWATGDSIVISFVYFV